MIQQANGRIVKGVGGLYYVKIESGQTVACRARGKFRHDHITPLVGDYVSVTFDEKILSAENDLPEARESVINEIVNRKSALIRPPLANLDLLFVSMAAAFPVPVLSTIDKLISIAEYNKIEPVIVIGKSELDSDEAARLAGIYRKGGFRVYLVSALSGEGVDRLKEDMTHELCGKLAAFSGASGVGKTSLMSRLFPEREFETGELSARIERGKNTTRHVEIFEYPCDGGVGYIADTPGFSMLDFVRFDFFGKDDLPGTMREFRPLIGKCRYKKCTHTKEDGCAILEAVKNGDIAPSRHDSFLEMYEALRGKHDWDK